MSRRVLPVVAAAAVAALVATSCSSDSEGSVFTGKVEDPSKSSGGEGEPKTPGSSQETATVAIQEVETYWDDTLPEVYGQTFTPPQGGYHPYGPDDLPPDCGDYSPSYEEMADNAFYCHLDDYIAWDENGLMPWLWDSYGGFTVAIVLAHEFGHAIQQRTGDMETASPLVLEQQADCFAGAWTGWVAEGNSEEFDVDLSGLDLPIAGLIAFRDPPGSSPTDMAAHGAGFDRVRAFQEGYEQGAERCAEYPELVSSGDLVITQMPFQQGEYQTGGDLHLEDQGEQIGLYTLAETNLQAFYEWLVDAYGSEWTDIEELRVINPGEDEVSCGGETLSGEEELEWAVAYCSEENLAIIDGETLAPELWENVGDFAVASEIGRLWARAAQSQLGVEDLDEKQASLQADCWTGVWSRAMWPDFDTGQVTEGMTGRLSAGDLDEVVMGFISYRQSRGERFGNVFERTSAFRDGFQEGLNSCHVLNPLDIQ